MFGCGCLCLSQLRGRASQRKHSPLESITVLLIVLGIGACSWDGFQVGVVIGWPLLQSLLPLLFLYFFLRQDQFLVENFVGGLVSLLFRENPCLDAEGSLSRFHITNVVSHS